MGVTELIINGKAKITGVLAGQAVAMVTLVSGK